MRQAVEIYLTKFLNLEQLRATNTALETRIGELETQVTDLEKSNEDLSRSIAAIALIQANLLRELQAALNNTKKTTQPVFISRKTDDYTN